MIRSQKRYTIDQYNKARINRKFQPINNPFAKDGTAIQINPDNTETITPKSISAIDELNDNQLVEALKYLESAEGQAQFNNANVAGPNGEGKRKATEQGGPSAKAPAIEETTTSIPTTTTMPNGMDVDTLAKGVNAFGGTGVKAASGGTGRGFSGGFSTATGPEVYVDRPNNFYNGCSLFYEKVHRVLGYGFSNEIMPYSDIVNFASTLLMTTSLMEIP